MYSLVSIAESPDPHCVESGLSNLVSVLSRRQHQTDQILTQIRLPRASTHQRCFSQFDRITQTRQGRSLNKYQRCSQNYGQCSRKPEKRGVGVQRSKRTKGSKAILVMRVQFPSLTTNWQKPAQDLQPSVSAVLALEPTWNGDLSTRIGVPNVERAGNMPKNNTTGAKQ